MKNINEYGQYKKKSFLERLRHKFQLRLLQEFMHFSNNITRRKTAKFQLKRSVKFLL